MLTYRAGSNTHRPNMSPASKSDKSLFREILFRHLDGIAIAPVMWALHEKGIPDLLLRDKTVAIGDLARQYKANEGYLNVALRMLCTQGWLKMTIEPSGVGVYYTITEKSAYAFSQASLYNIAVELMSASGQFHPRLFEVAAFEHLKRAFAQYKIAKETPLPSDPVQEQIHRQILWHIEGGLFGPTIVHLGMGGMFHKYFMEASFRPEEYHHHTEHFRQLLEMLAWMGWFTIQDGTFRFTDKGLFFAQRASAYGVTVSYLPLFRAINDLLFGDPDVIRNTGQGPERHVDREMNVWGSGGAHSTYFRKVDEFILDIFNQPILLQPKGILDMGCGNGAFLKHIYEVIEQRTLRGQMLDEYPLFLVGADYNEAALRVTRANLIQADIWAKVIWGDIGRPDILAATLMEQYGIDLADLLNVRTFLDHNRVWNPPSVPDPNRMSTSFGAFAFRGQRLPNPLVEESLKEHLLKWAPFVQKHGLLVIELHTIDPALAASHLGKTAVTAYDATHGFSDQYILELTVFRKVAAEAGLTSDPHYEARFPDNDLATVSIHLFSADKRG